MNTSSTFNHEIIFTTDGHCRLIQYCGFFRFSFFSFIIQVMYINEVFSTLDASGCHIWNHFHNWYKHCLLIHLELWSFQACFSKFNPILWNLYEIYSTKVHMFWEGLKFLRNIHCRILLCSNGQIYGGGFAKFCGLLRIYELYYLYCFDIDYGLNHIFLGIKLFVLQDRKLKFSTSGWKKKMKLHKISTQSSNQ